MKKKPAIIKNEWVNASEYKLKLNDQLLVEIENDWVRAVVVKNYYTDHVKLIIDKNKNAPIFKYSRVMILSRK